MMQMDKITITIFVDGDEPECLEVIVDEWLNIWRHDYSSFPELSFKGPINVKKQKEIEKLPFPLNEIAAIRNPDIFFYCENIGKVIGGIEITVHSPDGSNVEKRYPFIWASKKYGVNGFIATPYSKVRPNGSINRLPNRHSQRNLDILHNAEEYVNAGQAVLQQIVPTNELQVDDEAVPSTVKKFMFNWKDYAEFFAHYLANQISPNTGSQQKVGRTFEKLKSLANSCCQNTGHTEANTLKVQGDRWIQVYNTRPDSGHWERGEGQFDSIDGRLMFTLDQIDYTPSELKPKSFECWFPQLSREHAWVSEQRDRGYKSKRFKNIMVELRGSCNIKFLEDLSNDDIKLLQDNPSLTLERLDWDNNLFKVSDLIHGKSVSSIASKGLKSTPKPVVAAIEEILNIQNLYLCTFRVYYPNWKIEFINLISQIPADSTVLVPRVLKELLDKDEIRSDIKLKFAADCTKHELMAIRQIHRSCF
ncbi:hypothetical protein [Bowmanella pacifica]|uniref:Uncharacterized protein n=1 Tax=Bowmanella pacifica TaxID=502051 RepID=A0A917YWC3_9ALTE|nr:hypothetical protein [Bowmanella pacifica]GGO67262.1 hypothetical protein GCM10010982_13300 [Bowmanella pacifica]